MACARDEVVEGRVEEDLDVRVLGEGRFRMDMNAFENKAYSVIVGRTTGCGEVSRDSSRMNMLSTESGLVRAERAFSGGFSLATTPTTSTCGEWG